MTGTTRAIGAWAAGLHFEDIPPRLHAKTKAQLLSVIAAIHAGRHAEAAEMALAVARSWGGPAESTLFASGERLPHLSALFANCCHSVAFDFDDYLFAGHTGHSAVCTALAYGELTGASGRDLLAAISVANEVGGRLGAALLFGPHNGQMWAYIHLLAAACAAGRFLGCDAERMTHAIGIACAQPPYALMPAFMGSDSKLLIAASPAVEGARAAELAARGWTGAPAILEDPQGFLQKFNPQHLGWMLSGFGEAWLSDSLTYKVVPGCAYIDTAVDALAEIRRTFEQAHGRRLRGEDVADIRVRCGLLTAGMEAFSSEYRSSEHLTATSVNFSVALSFGLLLTAGALAPRYLGRAYLAANRAAIERVAAMVRLEQSAEMDVRAVARSEAGGFSLRALLADAVQSEHFSAAHARLEEVAAALGSGAAVDRTTGPVVGTPDAPRLKTLAGVSFEGYTMAFPAEVTVTTRAGEAYTALSEVPRGAAGRPWEETAALVREKLRANFAADAARAEAAIAAIDRLETVSDVREIIPLLAP